MACNKTEYMMRHYAHEVMQGKKETLAQMKGMQRKSIETEAEFVRLFWPCSSTSDPVCPHQRQTGDDDESTHYRP